MTTLIYRGFSPFLHALVFRTAHCDSDRECVFKVLQQGLHPVQFGISHRGGERLQTEVIRGIESASEPVALDVENKALCRTGAGTRAGLFRYSLRAPDQLVVFYADAIFRLIKQLKMPVGKFGIAGKLVISQEQRPVSSPAGCRRQLEGEFEHQRSASRNNISGWNIWKWRRRILQHLALMEARTISLGALSTPAGHAA